MRSGREHQPTMTRDRVREELITSGIGYVAGLGALLLWPQRENANQNVVFLVGIVILVVTAIVADMQLFNRRPSLGLGLRPARYSWPNFIGLIGAGIIVYSLRGSAVPERGLLAHAAGALVVIGGAITANLLWARDSDARPGDFPGH